MLPFHSDDTFIQIAVKNAAREKKYFNGSILQRSSLLSFALAKKIIGFSSSFTRPRRREKEEGAWKKGVLTSAEKEAECSIRIWSVSHEHIDKKFYIFSSKGVNI